MNRSWIFWAGVLGGVLAAWGGAGAEPTPQVQPTEGSSGQSATPPGAAVSVPAVTPIVLPNMTHARAQTKHHHYKLVVLEAFGGPTSEINMATDVNHRAVNHRGTAVGFAATAIPKLPTSHPIICGGDDGFGSSVTHALRWQNDTVRDLQALPPEEINCSNAYQVNSHGEIVGFSENGEFDPVTGTNQSRAVRWKNGKIEDLGSFGGNQNEALAINDKGQIVGFSLNTTPDSFSIFDNILNVILGSTGGTQTRAVLWDRGEMHDLGTLGGDDAAAFYINDRGQIAGVSYTSTVASIPVTGIPPLTAIPPQDVFLWDDGKMVDLGNLGGGYAMFTGQGGGLNNRGQVIGVSSVAANPIACFFLESDPNCHPFLWDGIKLIDLNTSTARGNPITADAINDEGDVVGMADFSGTGGSPNDAYLWEDGAVTDLGDATGDCFSRAMAVNSRRQIVGNSFSCDGSFDRAFLWENGSIVDLNTLIPPDSPLRLVDAKDVNDRGEIGGDGVSPGVDPNNVAGNGTNPGIGVRAFLLIPCDEDHPDIEDCDYSPMDVSTVGAGSAPTEAAAPNRLTLEGISRVRALLMQRSRGSMARTIGNDLPSASISAPSVSLSPTSLTFSTQAIGTTSAVQTVMLKNIGTTTLTISGITITGANAGDFAQTHTCGSSLAAGGSCTISVTFRPTASGARTAALSVADNAAGSPQKVSFTGIGTAATLSPTSLYFGQVQLGLTTGPRRPVTLTNVGKTTVTIRAIAITGTNAGDFAQTHSCGSSLAAGASCSIWVQFRPLALGTRTAALSVTDNAASSPQQTALSGVGVHLSSCLNAGQECPPQFGACCPGLKCVPASTRAFCEAL